MRGTLSKGRNPHDNPCPYSINFKSKPAPAGELNSLESGRLMIIVKLDGDSKAKVKEVVAKLVNKVKEKNLSTTQDASRLKRQTLITSSLVKDKRSPNRWAGKLGIPVTWIEGGTRTYERTGSSTPKSKGNLFTLDITYRLEGGRKCAARFGSDDVFHWTAKRRIV